MVAEVLFAQDVDPGAKAVENAVHLADGHRNAMLDRLDSGREVVECALDHAIHPRSLSLGPIGYVPTNPPTLSVLTRMVVLMAVRLSVMVLSLGVRS